VNCNFEKFISWQFFSLGLIFKGIQEQTLPLFSALLSNKFDYWDNFCAHYSMEVSQNDSAIPVSGIQ